MNRLRVLTALTTVVLVLAGAQWCFAESITLTSSGGGVYDYGLVMPPGVTTFDMGATITLSGLSGVTGASVPLVKGSLGAFGFTVNSFTSSSVVYAQTGPTNSFTNLTGAPITDGTLVVDSSVLTLGTVDFSLQPTTGTVTGTTQGPVVSAVPEPTSLVLLGAGLLGLVGLARRRSARTWRVL